MELSHYPYPYYLLITFLLRNANLSFLVGIIIAVSSLNIKDNSTNNSQTCKVVHYKLSGCEQLEYMRKRTQLKSRKRICMLSSSWQIQVSGVAVLISAVRVATISAAVSEREMRDTQSEEETQSPPELQIQSDTVFRK